MRNHWLKFLNWIHILSHIHSDSLSLTHWFTCPFTTYFFSTFHSLYLIHSLHSKSQLSFFRYFSLTCYFILFSPPHTFFFLIPTLFAIIFTILILFLFHHSFSLIFDCFFLQCLSFWICFDWGFFPLSSWIVIFLTFYSFLFIFLNLFSFWWQSTKIQFEFYILYLPCIYYSNCCWHLIAGCFWCGGCQSIWFNSSFCSFFCFTVHLISPSIFFTSSFDVLLTATTESIFDTFPYYRYIPNHSRYILQKFTCSSFSPLIVARRKKSSKSLREINQEILTIRCLNNLESQISF